MNTELTSASSGSDIIVKVIAASDRYEHRAPQRKQVRKTYGTPFKHAAPHLQHGAAGRAIRRAKRKVAKALLKWNGHSHGVHPPMHRADGSIR